MPRSCSAAPWALPAQKQGRQPELFRCEWLEPAISSKQGSPHCHAMRQPCARQEGRHRGFGPGLSMACDKQGVPLVDVKSREIREIG
jgi:hypothetical protein